MMFLKGFLWLLPFNFLKKRIFGARLSRRIDVLLAGAFLAQGFYQGWKHADRESQKRLPPA